MEPLGVVDIGNEVIDAGPCVFNRLEGAGVDFLG